ncbi:MAG: hypothetical protein IJD76_03145, partial [Bacilli bacterium]|nr:hypothetical protein [Bacilli bacterium]
AVYRLHILNDVNKTKLTNMVVDKVEPAITDLTVEQLDWEHDLAIFKDLVVMACAALTDPVNNVSRYQETKAFIKDAMNSPKAYINDTNAYYALDIIERALDTVLVQELLPNVANDYLAPKRDGKYAEFVTIDSTYTKDMAVSDAKVFVDVARSLVDFGAIAILSDQSTPIDWAKVNEDNEYIVSSIIDMIASTNYVVAKHNSITRVAQKVADKVNVELVDFDFGAINYSTELALVADLYDTLVGILEDSRNPLTSLEAIRAYSFSLDSIKFAFSSDHRASLKVAAELFLDSDTAYQAGPTLYHFVDSKLGTRLASYQFLLEASYTKAEINSDLKDLLAMAGIAEDAGIIEAYRNNTAFIVADTTSEIDNAYIAELLAMAWQLNMFNNVHKARVVNTTLSRFELFASVDAAELNDADWDNELVVFTNIIDPVCDLLVQNGIDTLQEVKSFLLNKEFASRSFLTEENVESILDIAEIAIDSKLLQITLPVVYNYAIDRVTSNETVHDLFKVTETDYTESEFVADLDAYISLGRQALELGIIELVFEKDTNIPEADAAVNFLNTMYAMNLINGRESKFASAILNFLAVYDRDVTSLNYTNEEDVLNEVVRLSIALAKANNIDRVSDGLSLVKDLRSDAVATAKAYMSKSNAYSVIEILDVLEGSEIYMMSLLGAYNKYQDKLPAAITSVISVADYTEADLRNDYPVILDMALAALDGNLEEVYREKREYSFPDYAVESISTILELSAELIILDQNFVSIVNKVASTLGLDITGLDVEAIHNDYSHDALVLADLVDELQAIWLGLNKLHVSEIRISTLAKEELFVTLHKLMNEVINNTTLGEEVYTWAFATYVKDRIPGNEMIDDIAFYNDEEALGLVNDMIRVLEIAIEMNVFGNDDLDFTNSSLNKELVSIIKRHVKVSGKLEKVLNRFANRGTLMGTIDKDYSLVTDDASETVIIKSVVYAMAKLAKDYGTQIAGNLSVVASDALENDVMNLLHMMEESVMISQSGIDLINGLIKVALPSAYSDYELIDKAVMPTFADFVNEVPTLFDIVDKAEELGVFGSIKYKHSQTMVELVELIENNVFIAGDEEMILTLALEKVVKLDMTEVDLTGIDWATEYDYLYEFLDHYGKAVNVSGVELTNISTLKNEATMLHLADAMDALGYSKVLEEVILPMYNKFAHRIPASFRDLLDFNRLTDDSVMTKEEKTMEDYRSMADILRLLSDSGIATGTVNNLTVDEILAVYDAIFGMNIVKGNEQAWFEKAASMGVKFGDEPHYEYVTDWDQEVASIRSALATLKHFVGDNGTVDMATVMDDVYHSTDAKGLEELLVALNHSVIYRNELFNIIDKKFNDNSTGNTFNISDFLTPWFTNQSVGHMASVEEWDEEDQYIARIIATLNAMDGLDSFDVATLPLGHMDVNADDLSKEYNAIGGGLRDLLRLFNASKSLDINALPGLLEDSMPIDTSKELNADLVDTNNDGVASKAEWDTEIDAIIALLRNAQSLELFSSSDVVAKLQSLSEAEIAIVLRNFNHSMVLRTMLPDFIHDSLETSNMTEWESDWLKAQTGATGTLAPVSEWDAEIDNLAKVIAKKDELQTIDLNNMTLVGDGQLDDSQLAEIEELLHLINNSQSFVLTPLADIIESAISTIGVTVEITNVPLTKLEWNNEITALFDVIEAIRAAGDFTLDASGTGAKAQETGEILDAMKATMMLGGATFNSIVTTWVKGTVIKDCMTDTEIDNADWTSYTWSDELPHLTSFTGLNSGHMEGEVLDEVMESQIFQDYFMDELVDEINTQLDSYSVTLFGTTYSLSQFINDGNDLTADDLAGRQWAFELAACDYFTELFENITIVNALSIISSIDNSKLVYPAPHTPANTLAKDASDKIIDIINDYLSSL